MAVHGRKHRIAFIYNHEGSHQIAHSAPVLKALTQRADAPDLHVLASSDAALTHVRSIVGDAAAAQITWQLIGPPAVTASLIRAFDRIGPASRLATLSHHRHIFDSFDAIVATETTSLALRKRFGVTRPVFIYTSHGAGDRSISVHPSIGQFDLLLLSGEKMRRRLVELGVAVDEKIQLVGYPKFDLYAERLNHPARLFNNDKPVVLYNPHFDPLLSSWFSMGRQVLDFFTGHTEYNLVFAPHLMLFKRKLHASVEHRHLRLTGTLADRYQSAPNILIDTSSSRLTDMTYTGAADIYLGDVSSQIYEFLLRPRPCIFLNSHNAAWQGNDNYLHWKNGPVLSHVSELADCLATVDAWRGTYAYAQAAALADTFSITHTPAATRAANAIMQFLETNRKFDPLATRRAG